MTFEYGSAKRSNGPGAAHLERRASRTPLTTKARLTQQNWYSFDVSLCDLSTCGFQAECPENVSIGSYVMLDVPGLGPVRAQVRWQIGNRMGGMFLDPVRLSKCEWTATPVPPTA